MATVLVEGEIGGRGFTVKRVAGEKRFIIEDSGDMSPEELKKIKLAAWSMSLRRGQSNSSELSEEKPAGGSQYRSGRLGLRKIPGHRYPGRREGCYIERSDKSDPTAALLGEKALQSVGCPINSEWLDFDGLSRYMDRPSETEEVKLTDWGLFVTRHLDGRAMMSIPRPKWRGSIRDRSPKLSSNALLLMQENPYPMSIEDLCQAFMERFVKASDAEKERLWGTVETVGQRSDY